MIKKRKFKLISGRHSNNTDNYQEGDIVESYENLAVMFANKFIEVTDSSPAELKRLAEKKPVKTIPAADELNEGEDDEDDDEPDISNPNEDAHDENQADALADTRSKNAPQPHVTDPNTQVHEQNQKDALESDEEDDLPVASAVKSKLGKDVTFEFPEAKAAEFNVFKDSKGYYVGDPDDVNAALNLKPLKKSEVAAKIEKLTK